MGFVNDRSEEPWKTIDWERNITFINKKVRMDEGVWVFDLDVNGEKFVIEVLMGSKNLGNGKGFDVQWKIFRILPEEKVYEKIKDIAKEAFEAHGMVYSSERVASIKIEF